MSSGVPAWTERWVLVGCFVLSSSLAVDASAQPDPPLVYSEENTGAGLEPTHYPSFDDLPIIRPLTDPFEFSDGSGRSVDFADWNRRRAEINGELQHYEIGEKPPRPENTTATFVPNATGGTLTVIVTENGQSLTLTSQVALPAGSGPYPAVIGMNSLSGSIPAATLTSRNIARIQFNHNNVTTYGFPLLSNPFYRLYPHLNLENTGQYTAWSWGVSRLIDGLELVQDQLPIDLEHLAVTGCSYAGKMALFAGALDERIALTMAVESGGGGAPAWRVSETLGNVETIGNTDYRWFADQLRQFIPLPAKLPYDHHELMAMVAPRALLVTGNTDFEWLANPSAYVSARATQLVYEAFEIADRFGVFIDGGHGHCTIPASQLPAFEAFIDKFLLGDTSVDTEIRVHPYGDMDYQRWTEWWGTGDPKIPDFGVDATGATITYFEAECAAHGANWQVHDDPLASNGKYVTIRPGLNSTGTAPTGEQNMITVPFSVEEDGSYYFFARVNNPSVDDDSFWMSIDDAPFVTVNGLGSVGWQWVDLTKFGLPSDLTAGEHTLRITYREDGATLDKLAVTNFIYGPYELGTAAPTYVTIEAETDVISLWPPNHKYHHVNLNDLGLSFTNNLNCDPVLPESVVITRVTSDEPENGDGDGNTVDDIVIASDFRSVALRSERQGGGNGRVYTIHLGVFDGDRIVMPTTVQVHVPHSKNSGAIDDGVAYEVIGAGGAEFADGNSSANKSALEEMPTEFQLEPNYPNPFNPSTNISYQLPEQVHVRLQVFDMTGKHVATLVDGVQSAGRYTAVFDGSGLASGVYVMRFVAGPHSQTNKMILLK